MTQRDEREKMLEDRWPINHRAADMLKAICSAGERCSCADKNGQWYDQNCAVGIAHVNAIALRTPADGEAHAEIQRLQDAKRRALAIADERAKENVALREVLVKSRQWVEANTAQVRGLSREAAAPGEAMLAEIDAALSRDPADTIEPDQGEDHLGERP